MDSQILTLYAKGLSTREIVGAFKEMYDTDVSATPIPQVTDRVIERMTADLKRIYQAATEALAQKALEEFGTTWNSQYPQIAKSWTSH